MSMQRFILLALFGLLMSLAGRSQERVLNDSILSFEEYIAYIKEYNPLVKQANLKLTEGEATLLAARGGFDPKAEVYTDRKDFKDTEYWDKLKGTFSIPTWYGVEFKANYEDYTGTYLNNELTVPEDGLYSAGVSLNLARDLLINKRMADLKSARAYVNQTQAERDLLVNNFIYEAGLAYLKWVEAFTEREIYRSFVENAQERLNNIEISVRAGDMARIDITEARIQLKNRQLSLEMANLNTRKALLEASSYLWFEEVPLEIEPNVVPALPAPTVLSSSLQVLISEDEASLNENHPKLRSLNAKIEGLEVDRNLKRNNLLPKITLDYYFLSDEVEQLSEFNTQNYKTGLTFSMPLFLRKERGELKLANAKLQSTIFERQSTLLTLQNKIKAINQEINSIQTQQQLIGEIITGYDELVIAEVRKFEIGESSLFLINQREVNLIEAFLKENNLNIKELQAIFTLFNTLGTQVRT
ncbi:TolC family protein [Aequorivita echinoideorum]|uniref:TolC family protein n=1 Tax=Aequorivita echinoideorum TaxID=1549647 RepID=A0ABS5S2J2_9FLAO|nr:TolC family protein [Aequorivita echinoideorum]MBT0607218.1 TolC family protein [Aequorivita echinoideorum]